MVDALDSQKNKVSTDNAETTSAMEKLWDSVREGMVKQRNVIVEHAVRHSHRADHLSGDGGRGNRDTHLSTCCDFDSGNSVPNRGLESLIVPSFFFIKKKDRVAVVHPLVLRVFWGGLPLATR